ncbi:class I SAM-dependent methyltransferase [Alkalimarinus alittae]|uniref:Class I SAM-dependent methyltransferase n=1 Tax=Alkalimarinus alittae TaxID=2961619 RepID=A0ABY6N7D5_9ALTE|nr:class I SAM-dependent methyltransferase [Alkalimarinus alittae]UZE97882.1 class I SAM-dependent methyltransferase [Alkalimarinus alittae]
MNLFRWVPRRRIAGDIMGFTRTKEDCEYLHLQHTFEAWFQSSLGRVLLSDQRRKIDGVIGRMFGYHQLEMLVSHRFPMGNSSSLGHKIVTVPEWQSDMPENTLVAEPHELGLCHDSIDLAILHHTLDYTVSPHQALREASRVVKSSGHLLIIGFNPMSMWGVRKLVSRKKAAPWNGRFTSGHRVEDWLKLLDFEITSADHHFLRPPVQNYRLLERFAFADKFDNGKFPMGAYYMILAKKQVGCSISAKPKWKETNVIGLPVANRMKP